MVGHEALGRLLNAPTPDVLTGVVALVIVVGIATQLWWTNRKMLDFRSVLADMAESGRQDELIAWYERRLEETFGARNTLRGGLLGVLIALLLTSLIGWPFVHDSVALNVYDIVGGVVLAFFAGVSQWTFHQVGTTISRLPSQPVDPKLHGHRSSDVFYLGKMMLKLWLWIVGLILVGDLGVATAPVPDDMQLIGHLAVVSLTLAALVWFFAVQWNIHRMMTEKKRSRLQNITTRLDAALKQPLTAIDDGTMDRVRHLRWLYDQIDDLPEWPFDTRTVMQVFTSSIVPIVVAILQLVL